MGVVEVTHRHMFLTVWFEVYIFYALCWCVIFLYYWWLDFNLKIFFGILLKCFDFMIVKLVFSVLPIDIICL